MKIQVCGCSYFSLDKNFPNTHFTEILANQLNATLINLSSPGSSNFAIRLQVQSSLEFKPDLVVLGFTSPDRLDYPVDVKNNYKPSYHVHNLYYNDSPPFIKSNLASIKSDPIPALSRSNNQDCVQAVKQYVNYFYDYNLQKHKDYIIAQSALYFLRTKNIPFIFSEGGLGNDDFGLFSDFEMHHVKSGNPWDYTSKGDDMWSRSYHTNSESQIKLSEIWLENIQRLV